MLSASQLKRRKGRTSSLVISEIPSPPQENLRNKETRQIPVTGKQTNNGTVGSDVALESVSSKNAFGEEGKVEESLQTNAVAAGADDALAPINAMTSTLKTEPFAKNALEDNFPTNSLPSESTIALNTAMSERKLQTPKATGAKMDKTPLQLHHGTRASYYQNLNYFNEAFAQSERKRRPTRKAPVSPDQKRVVAPGSDEKGKSRRPTRSAPKASLKVSPMKAFQQTSTNQETLTIDALSRAPQSHRVSPIKALKQAPKYIHDARNRTTKTNISGRGRAMSIILKRDKGSVKQVELESSLDQLNKKMMNEAKLEALKFNESVETVMKNINQRMNSSDTTSPKAAEKSLRNADMIMEQAITASSVEQGCSEIDDESRAVEDAARAPLPRTIEFPVIHEIVNEILNSHWTKATSVQDLRRLGYRDKMPYYCHNLDKYWHMIKKVHQLYSFSKEELLYMNVNALERKEMTKGRAIHFARDFDIIPKLLKHKEFCEILDLLVGKSSVLFNKYGIPHTKFASRGDRAFKSLHGNSNLDYETIRRSNNMHYETHSQAFARTFEEDSRKTFDSWTFAKILYVCADVALQKGRYQLVFPFFEDRVDGFFTMVPGIANESLLNAAATKRKFEVSHIKYL